MKYLMLALFAAVFVALTTGCWETKRGVMLSPSPHMSGTTYAERDAMMEENTPVVIPETVVVKDSDIVIKDSEIVIVPDTDIVVIEVREIVTPDTAPVKK